LKKIDAYAPGLYSRDKIDKVYEIFIFTLILESLENIDARFSVYDYQGNPSNVFIFRGAPGLIYTPTTKAGFVSIEYNGNRYELHNGLRVIGKSNVLHELDICILDKKEADRCRLNRINPRYSKIRMLIECKYYGSYMPIALGREFIGLSSEIAIRIKAFISNNNNQDLLKLISRYGCTGKFDLQITNGRAMRSFIGWMATELENTLK
jgi:hypothetical protein